MANDVYDDKTNTKSGSNYWQSESGSLDTDQLKEKETKEATGAPSTTRSSGESESGGPTNSGFYNSKVGSGQGSADGEQNIQGWVRHNRRKLFLGGGAIAGVTGVSALLFFMLLPLKIEDIVQNLESHFFASPTQAVENETANMFSNYIAKVLPTYTACGSTISKDCTPAAKLFSTQNPVSRLYSTWANARLENKLASDYGIEFTYNPNNRIWSLKAPGTGENGDEIGSIDTTASAAEQATQEAKVATAIDTEFASKAAMRDAVSNALKQETKWYQVMFRYKVGRLLEEKYGIARCVMFCGTRDAFSDFASQKVNAAQIMLVQRVITPRNQALGIVMECLLDTNCNPEQTNPTTEESTSGSGEGEINEPENVETDGQLTTTLEERAAEYGITDDETIQGMITDYNSIESGGYSGYVINKVLTQVGLGDFSKQVTDAVPIIGWVTTIATIVTNLHKLGPSLRKLAYITNAAAAVSLYMEYRSYADEVHTGNVDATELGSMTNSLGSGNQSSVGGTATAEDTPLYQNLIDTSNTSSSGTLSLLASLTSGDAYADANSSDYTCANGQPVPAGQLVCPEEQLDDNTEAQKVANNISAVTDEPGVNLVTDVANAISKVSGFVSSMLGSVISKIPGVGSISNLVGKIIGPVFQFITGKLINDPFSNNMSGGRTFDMMAAGADVSGNDFAHNSLGGQQLTPTQSATISYNQQSEAQEQFKQESFFAQLFNTSSPYSAVSRIAVDLPSSSASAEADAAGLISNPFSSVLHSIAAILPGFKAAAAAPQADPFDVTQYGYPSGSIPTDPETYWDQHKCGETTDDSTLNTYSGTGASDPSSPNYNPNYAWQLLASDPTGNPKAVNSIGAPEVDPNTDMPLNTTTDPCLLIQASVGSAGGLFNSNLLTTDDLADVGNGQ